MSDVKQGKNDELYNILKFIENGYKSWSEIRKHFEWTNEKAQIISDVYFAPKKLIQHFDSTLGLDSKQMYIASVDGKKYIKQQERRKKSLWNKISHNPFSSALIAGLILLIIGAILKYLGYL